MLLMKRFGVIEQSHKNAIPAELVHAAKNKSVTPSLLYEQLVLQPMCNQRIDHISVLSSQSIELLMKTVPEVIKNNPLRYPFLFPNDNDVDKSGDRMEWKYLWKVVDPDELRNITLCKGMHHHRA